MYLLLNTVEDIKEGDSVQICIVTNAEATVAAAQLPLLPT